MQAAEASLPAISKATVFVMVSKGVPEAEGDADIIYHVPGAFQHLQGRRGWGGELLGPLCVGSHHGGGAVWKDRARTSHYAPCTTCYPGAFSVDLMMNAASKLATKEVL